MKEGRTGSIPSGPLRLSPRSFGDVPVQFAVDHLGHPPGNGGAIPAPFDDLTGLAHQELRTEDRVAALPARHRLAGRSAIRLSELEGEVFPRWKGVPGNVGEKPEIADAAELASLVAIGRVIAVLPRSLLAPVPPGLVCVTVEDAEPSRLVVAHLEHDRRDSVRAFVDAAVQAAAAA